MVSMDKATKYWSPYHTSGIIAKAYELYASQLQSGVHLPSHLEDTVQVYASALENEGVIDDSFEVIIFHIHAIFNSFDDFIDESPPSRRKAATVRALIIFSSFFVLFNTIATKLIPPASTASTALACFFDESYKMVQELAKAAHADATPPILETQHMSASEIGELILQIQKNRCHGHHFISQLLDFILKAQNHHFGSISQALVTYKGLEMIVRDLNPQEIIKDMNESSFNIVLYLRNGLGITEEKRIIKILTSTKQLFSETFEQVSKHLPCNTKELLSSQFEQKLSELDDALGDFGPIYNTLNCDK